MHMFDNLKCNLPHISMKCCYKLYNLDTQYMKNLPNYSLIYTSYKYCLMCILNNYSHNYRKIKSENYILRQARNFDMLHSTIHTLKSIMYKRIVNIMNTLLHIFLHIFSKECCKLYYSDSKGLC